MLRLAAFVVDEAAQEIYHLRPHGTLVPGLFQLSDNFCQCERHENISIPLE